jgi:hypothetical protein
MVRAAWRLFSFYSHARETRRVEHVYSVEKASEQLSLSLILFNLRIPRTHTLAGNIYLFGLAQELKRHSDDIWLHHSVNTEEFIF